MNRLRGFLASYHPIVFSLLIGHMIARIATSMSMPFLALYLAAHTDMGPGGIGFIVGAGALAATFGGFLGGALSDRYSRRLVMFASLFVWSGVFAGFALTDSPAVLLLLSLMNGLCRSWFEPVSQVLMADLTPKDRRMSVFSMRYLMANVGVAIGPVLGVWLGLGNGDLAFMITGAIYFVYAITLYIMMIAFGIKDIEGGKQAAKATIADAGRVVMRDAALRLFLLGGIVVGIGYSQLFGNMAPHLDRVFGHGDRMFGYLLTINAVTVIALQLPLGWLANKRPPLFALHAGNLFLALGLAGIGWADTFALQVVAMILFTVGEILNYPAATMLLDKLAPEHLRGAYYGAQTFTNLGQFIGPWAGGWLLGEYGGRTMFAAMAVVVLLSSLVYRAGSRDGRKARAADNSGAA
ncbi:MFS transporter [Cohnella sp. GbtcB17]|uniref:MDR family MFS transporter n=1 Tax=Cohnella sp. GbtcB17 TaxID=2824762 RepID=UPI001C2F8128|nr:MFS transporter [Cohnella sp. GbtcB17]